jgi:hypothetical protein
VLLTVYPELSLIIDTRVQLEAANRQLRSTRQFVEEQASEREHERDEFARTLAALRDDNARLSARIHNTAAVLAEVLTPRPPLLPYALDLSLSIVLLIEAESPLFITMNTTH